MPTSAEPVKRSQRHEGRLNFGCGIVHRPKVLLLPSDGGRRSAEPVRLIDSVATGRQRPCVLLHNPLHEEAQDLLRSTGDIARQAPRHGTLDERT